MMILKSLKRFFNDDTITFHNNDIETILKSSTMMMLKKFHNDDTKKVRQLWYKNSLKTFTRFICQILHCLKSYT